MKNLFAFALGFVLFACTSSALAQNTKDHLNEPAKKTARIFTDLPEKMNLRVNDLESLFSFSLGQQILVKASDEFVLEGTVVSVSDARDRSVQSVVVRSSSRPGAIFTFSIYFAPDGITYFDGRMMSRDHADAFQIVGENGQYFLKKKEYADMIDE